MKKAIALCLAALMLLAMAACGKTAEPAPAAEPAAAAAPAAESTDTTGLLWADGVCPGKTKTYLSFASASMGGGYYPVGIGLSDLINEKLSNIEMTVEVTGGSSENCRLVGGWESDLGIANVDALYDAYNGENTFEGSTFPDLRIMADGLLPGTEQLVVPLDSDIQSYADLAGKRVSVGPQGGTNMTLVPRLLEYYGLSMDDMKCSFMGYDDSVQELVDGNLDACIILTAHPANAIKTLMASSLKFKILGVEDDIRAKFLEEHPYYAEVVIPADTYELGYEVYTVASRNCFVVNANVPDDVVYNLLTLIYDNLERMKAAHQYSSTLTIEGGVNESIPMHPGAIQFFTERGIYGG